MDHHPITKSLSFALPQPNIWNWCIRRPGWMEWPAWFAVLTLLKILSQYVKSIVDTTELLHFNYGEGEYRSRLDRSHLKCSRTLTKFLYGVTTWKRTTLYIYAHIEYLKICINTLNLFLRKHFVDSISFKLYQPTVGADTTTKVLNGEGGRPMAHCIGGYTNVSKISHTWSFLL